MDECGGKFILQGQLALSGDGPHSSKLTEKYTHLKKAQKFPGVQPGEDQRLSSGTEAGRVIVCRTTQG